MPDKQGQSTSAASPQGKNDPLAVLERVLDETKQKSASDVKTMKQSDVDTSQQTATIAVKTEAAEKETAAAIEEHHAQLEAERLRLIEKQRRELKTELKQTPQYQARLAQEAEKAKKQDQAAADNGFQIRQLDHTKI